jgi:hypothetical protein
MSKHELSEDQLLSWTPRRPSDKIARQLFGTRPVSSAWKLLHAPDLWNWLTPAAACLVTMLVFVSGGYQRPAQPVSGDCATFYATVMLDASHNSNVFRQTFSMNRVAVNMEWNVIPGFSVPATNPDGIIESAVSETNRLVR